MVSSDPSFYFERLYPLQDDVLRQVTALDTGFYLSGVSSLDSASQNDWAAVKWITAPDPVQFVRDLQALAESLILNPE